ncbi:MAG TPA: chloride channel protein [Anaeromyxobacteraceae bacterium]|nr:chloride channel protein [Anaeromyxobacteraceae bacterium]
MAAPGAHEEDGDPGARPGAARRSGWARAGHWLARAVPRGSGFESTRSLSRWLLVAGAIGIVAGLGAAVFFRAIEAATSLFLGALVGYQPPLAAGEGGTQVTVAARPWLLPLVTTAGGLLSGALVFGLAPEAEGHGTDSAIEAIHRRSGSIRARIPLVKLVASAITIGSGGSAGREGPAAQISAGFASLLGRLILPDPQERRIAVAAGIGAGIGAIFRAPLGGALLAAEILYVHDIEVEAIIPSLIASIVAYAVYGAWMGYGPIFGAHGSLELGAPVQLLYYAALGVASGLVGLLYARSFYGMTAVFSRLALPRWLKPGLGGLALGLLGLALPQALHTGYGWVQLEMTREGLLSLSPLVLLAIPLGKILATGLTVGSGGSGGIFGPGMVIGGSLGALLWRLGMGVLPDLPPQPAPFVIIGMMALFGGIAHAPLAVMLMVAEMTGTLSLLAPAMIAVAISTALVGNTTIYHAQLPSRADSPAHRLRLAFPLLSALTARDAAAETPVALDSRRPAGEARARLTGGGEQVAVFTGEGGRLLGAVARGFLERLGPEAAARPLAEVSPCLVLPPEKSLDEALQALTEAGASAAAVSGDPVAAVTVQGILRAYREARRRVRPPPTA